VHGERDPVVWPLVRASLRAERHRRVTSPNAPLQTAQAPQIINGERVVVPAANIQLLGSSAPTLVGGVADQRFNSRFRDYNTHQPTQVVAIETSATGALVPSGGGGLGRPVIIYVNRNSLQGGLSGLRPDFDRTQRPRSTGTLAFFDYRNNAVVVYLDSEKKGGIMPQPRVRRPGLNAG